MDTDDVVLFNHSPSIPEGFYVRTEGLIETGAVVTVRARDVAPAQARARHYDEAEDRFIKRVAAVGGQRVCGDGHALLVEGRQVGVVFASGGGETPAGWVGCRRLHRDEILLLGDSADSFDGRYWGPISTDRVEGVWRPF